MELRIFYLNSPLKGSSYPHLLPEGPPLEAELTSANLDAVVQSALQSEADSGNLAEGEYAVAVLVSGVLTGVFQFSATKCGVQIR